MDKFECEELTRIAYAMYNIPIMLAEEKHVFRSWFSMLSDIEYEAANEAFTDLAVYSHVQGKSAARPSTRKKAAKSIQMLQPRGAYSRLCVKQQRVVSSTRGRDQKR